MIDLVGIIMEPRETKLGGINVDNSDICSNLDYRHELL